MFLNRGRGDGKTPFPETTVRRQAEAAHGSGAGTSKPTREPALPEATPTTAQAEIQAELARYIDLYDLAPVAYYTLQYDGRIEQANILGASLLGVQRPRLKYRNFRDFVCDELQPVFDAFLGKIFSSHVETSCDLALRPGGGRPKLQVRTTAIADDKDRTCKLVLFDITRQQQAEEAWHRKEQGFREMIDATDGIVWEASASTLDFTYVSGKAERLLGYPAEAWKKPGFWAEHLHPEDRDWVLAHCAACTDRLEAHDFEYRFVASNGRSLWLRDLVTVAAEKGKPRWRRGVTVDITASKLMESALWELVSTDYLTGIPKRRQFMARLEDEFARLKRSVDYPVAVLMLDLDHFKRINDTHGHAVGDAALAHFTALMRDQLRKIDTVGRTDGDEFSIILPGTDAKAARIFAERLRQKVVETPARHGDLLIPMTVSVGVAIMEASDASADTALIRAGEALARAKENWRQQMRLPPDRSFANQA